MNKKILTLIASVLVLLGTVFSANAQDIWDLGIGKNKDVDLKSSKYYHLKIDSIIVEGNNNKGVDAIGPNRLDSTLVLFMKDTLLDNQNRAFLFVDSINTTYRGESLNTVRSASSLWCVSVEIDQQGKNKTFDFVNKHSSNLLELDVAYPEHAYGDTAFIPGAVMGWHFSETDGLSGSKVRPKQPLYSYVTLDTVAVLTIDPNFTYSPGPSAVIVRTVHVKDLYATSGVLLFSVAEPRPFVLTALDINTKFGQYKDFSTNPVVQKLKFTEDVDGNHTNPFSAGIFARSLLTASAPTTRTGIAGRDTVAPSWLDSLGYLLVSTDAGTNLLTTNYVYVDTAYYLEKGPNKGDRYLKFGQNTSGSNLNAYFNNGGLPLSRADSVMWPQFAFRFVYDPSEDNIRINAYKSTWWPEDYKSGVPTLVGATAGLTAFWSDTTAQYWYSFVADTSNLDYYGKRDGSAAQHLYTYDTTRTWADTLLAPLRIANLQSPQTKPALGGYSQENGYVESTWRVTQRLYVNVQDLTGSGIRALTLAPKPDVKINFGIYSSCGDVEDTRRTLDADLYLIRNTKGEYLRVPLYSATDSCEWEEPERDEFPELLPSYQWIVEKSYSGAGAPFTIVNREFPWLRFANIQLRAGVVDTFTFRGTQRFEWNTEKINSDVVKLSEDNGTASFILIDDTVIKKNQYLGYTYIPRDESITNLYALNYYHSYDADNYIGWGGDLNAYPNTDTAVFVKYKNSFDRLYFRFDTVNAPNYGDLQPYGYDVEKGNAEIKKLGIAQLVRQPYRLSYEDALKYRCNNNFSLTNGEQGTYVVAPKNTYKEYLGKPVFYLRHTRFYKEGEEKKPYFALVQTIDTTTTFANLALQGQFSSYLDEVYGKALRERIFAKLNSPEKFNPALFVAAVEEKSPNKLLMTLRAEAHAGTVSTFRLEEDADPIYRRFDNPILEGPGDGPERDAPKTVNFYQHNHEELQLYENTGYVEQFGSEETWSGQRAGYGKRNYLGEANIYSTAHIKAKTNTNIYVDTAYVNRGTGHIKPQYLLVVDPVIHEPGESCDPVGGQTRPEGGEYLRGRFLINAYDSAHVENKKTGVTVHRAEYLWDTQWERLVFVDAIHAKDHLFILGSADPAVLKDLQYADGTYDIGKLYNAAVVDSTIVSVDLANNKHKDCVFSFRYIERNGTNFVIESESTGRDTVPMIRPCQGGWIKVQNNVPVISRALNAEGKYVHDAMSEATVFDVKPGVREQATANETVETPAQVTVVGDAGAVTILGAGGKKVVITNVLGQTVTSTVLTSDNATVAAPKGIVLVSVEGEKSVKTIVK